MSNPIFKQDNQGEILLFPARLDENIPENHLVRVVNRIVNTLDLGELLAGYKGGGASAYHPRMLLKVLLYAYCLKIYSGRKIADALSRDITFMWLSGKQTPNFRTLNDFRSSRLKDSIDEIFKSLLYFMFEEGYLRFEEYYCDGTTILADTNKHKVTWKKNLERYRDRVESRIDQTLKEIDELTQAENAGYEETDAYLVADDAPGRDVRIEKAGQKLNKLLQSSKEKKVVKKAQTLDKSLQEDLIRVEVYKKKEDLCGDRSGYSSTDPDASPMRTKECSDDLRPAYNILTGSENQYITGISVHQNPNDGTCFTQHMEHVLSEVWEGKKTQPDVVIADAVFGTEENYEYLEKKHSQEENKAIEGLLKYPSYDKEKESAYQNDPFRKENMPYDVESDSYLCPWGKRFIYQQTVTKENKNGFKSTLRLYQCESCQGCPHFKQCGGKREENNNRRIQVNDNLERHKEKVRQKLDSPKGKERMSQRGHDIETCFGDIKHNQLFRRVHLRGLKKVKIEVMIVAISHNLRKMHLEEVAKAG